MQDDNDQVQAGSGANRTGKNKEKSPGLMCLYPKAVFEVSVNACKIHPVIKRNQYKSNDHIPQQITQYHLVISKPRDTHCAWNRNKCDTGEGSTDHAEGNQQPVGPAVADKERFIV